MTSVGFLNSVTYSGWHCNLGGRRNTSKPVFFGKKYSFLFNNVIPAHITGV